MTKILMVCLGNICRSPLAEGILRSKLPTKDYFIDSAGTGNYHTGSAPDKRSIDIAKTFGLNISNQKARQFKVSDFDNFDYIYVMDDSNYENVIALARNENDINKVQLILNEAYPNENLNVPDPYYGGTDGFKNVYLMLDEACNNIAKKLT
ncbi:low molecular weight protein-tyrosine-phosphatase [Siansivirga zeaxanthinifaciens]|uniref:protein-tyrosine-phosphatase n=1 Tax=Siansivirga zeaxanthinifaciens CC-SAMT-1 TaxID=1454006 RepID=A0A0C5WBU4_9FLAO|nr:low molecular weight protein-tyrosine-phosphatase [Siansivirga zeaxanthinifaciens]AJR04573.1 protein tyrosine phosphatase [Siansivirga zeaxanthinifaciens CC-SAMT-1]